MRFVTAALITLLAAVSPTLATSPAPKAPAKKAAFSTAKLKIEGMHCDGCAKGVAQKLQGVKGVKSAKVTVKSSDAVVQYDPAQVKPQDLVQAVQRSGYGAKLDK